MTSEVKAGLRPGGYGRLRARGSGGDVVRANPLMLSTFEVLNINGLLLRSAGASGGPCVAATRSARAPAVLPRRHDLRGHGVRSRAR